MIEFKTLDNFSIKELTAAFNEGFSDYVVKFNATEEYLDHRWKGARVRYEYSAGMLLNGHLKGILVHGIDDWNGKKTAFNCATCVAPAARGNAFTARAYDFLMPMLHEIGIEQMALEVIQSNTKAVKVYEKVGFGINRDLKCLRGAIQAPTIATANAWTFRQLDEIPSPAWLYYEPTWENMSHAIRANPAIHETFAVIEEKAVLAYTVVEKARKRIKQLFIDPNHRTAGVGEYLFQHLSIQYPEIDIVNVPDMAKEDLALLRKIGLEDYIAQFEMCRKI